MILRERCHNIVDFAIAGRPAVGSGHQPCQMHVPAQRKDPPWDERVLESVSHLDVRSYVKPHTLWHFFWFAHRHPFPLGIFILFRSIRNCLRGLNCRIKNE